MSGTVHLLQRHRNSEITKVGVQLDGIERFPGDVYGFCITEFSANLNSNDPCAAAAIGDVYNPEGIDTSLASYRRRCEGNHSECAIGDLATRHSLLTDNDTGTFVEYRDIKLNLYGPNTVVGRAMTLKGIDTGETLSCCNIEVPTNARVLRARYDDGVFRGEITMTIPQYDYFDYTKNENTIIMVDLERIDGGPANISMLGWQIQRGYADESCSNLEDVLGPPRMSIVMPGDPGTGCSPTEHRECRLGDLTTKCGPLQLENNRIRAQCTDNQLGLTSFSTLDRAAVSITQGSTILDCAQLNEQMSAGGYVNFGFNGGYTNLAFSQLSQNDPTMYRTYVIGLNGQAGNIVVYDGPDCDNLGNVLDYSGNLPEPNPKTSDQYPVGELGPKMGGVRGKDYLRTQGLSSNIPLTGPVNILDKPIAVLFENGTVWGCGMVEDYYNMPYNPPTDVFDYLDLWRPPTA